MSPLGQSRRLGAPPAASGLAQSTDIARLAWADPFRAEAEVAATTVPHQALARAGDRAFGLSTSVYGISTSDNDWRGATAPSNLAA
jgi:hypothetical protein